MKENIRITLLSVLLAAWLSGCSSTSPARLCDSPLVRVNALPATGSGVAAHGATDHE